jgi:hypothetical protein
MLKMKSVSNPKQNFERLHRILRPLYNYHQVEFHDSGEQPWNEGCLICIPHSLATYDALLLDTHLSIHSERPIRAVTSEYLHDAFLIGAFWKWIGTIEPTWEAMEEVLRNGDNVFLLPGGSDEATRSHKQKRQYLWEKRSGFLKLAMATSRPIVIAYCPRADDIFEATEIPSLSRHLLKHYRLVTLYPRGLLGLPIPKPVKLDFYLSRAIYPGPTLEEFRERVFAELKSMQENHK